MGTQSFRSNCVDSNNQTSLWKAKLLSLPDDKFAVHFAVGRSRGAMRWGLSWQIERGNGRGDRENRKHA